MEQIIYYNQLTVLSNTVPATKKKISLFSLSRCLYMYCNKSIWCCLKQLKVWHGAALHWTQLKAKPGGRGERPCSHSNQWAIKKIYTSKSWIKKVLLTQHILFNFSVFSPIIMLGGLHWLLLELCSTHLQQLPQRSQEYTFESNH